MFGCVTMILMLTALIAGERRVSAQDLPPPLTLARLQPDAQSGQLGDGNSSLSRDAAPSSLWRAGVGEGFNRGAQELGFSLGYGLGVKVFGGGTIHNWGIATAEYGWVLTDVVAADHWYRGNWELLGQVFGGGQYHPNAAYFAGGGPLLRYNFAVGHRWVPFIDAGGGGTATDIRNGDLSATFEFNLQIAIGARYFLKDNLALTAQCRFMHLSDAGITSPNLGVNTRNFLLGVTWFF